MRLSRRSLLGVGAAVTVAASLVLAPSAPADSATSATFGRGAPGFTSGQVPPSFPSADFAGEPSLGISGTTGAALYMAGSSTYRVSLSGGAVHWGDVSSPVSVLNVDPILATDPSTGVTLAGGDDGPCAVLSLSRDDGTSWTPALPCALAIDHPTVGFGPFAGAPPAGASGSRIAYFCQQEDVGFCARSLDDGATWLPGVAENGCYGLFGHVKVGPDGTAYVPSRTCTGANGSLEVGGFASRDNGVTWNSYGIPDAPTPSHGFDPSVAVTPDNTLYEGWSRAGDYHLVVASSTDHGQAWSSPVDLSNTVSPPLVASAFPAMVAGDNGRVAVAYLGTRVGTDGVSPFTSGYHGVWNLFVSTSYNGGATWTTTQVSTNGPVQRGSISDSGAASTGQRNLLDFIDAQVTPDGRVVVAYADGCNGACASSSGTEAQSSTDAYASAAWQVTGEGLRASSDRPATSSGLGARRSRRTTGRAPAGR